MILAGFSRVPSSVASPGRTQSGTFFRHNTLVSYHTRNAYYHETDERYIALLPLLLQFFYAISGRSFSYLLKNTDPVFNNADPVVQTPTGVFSKHRPVFQSGFQSLRASFSNTGRGFSRSFFYSRPAFWLSATAGFLHVLFPFPPYCSRIVAVHFPVTDAFPSHGGNRL